MTYNIIHHKGIVQRATLPSGIIVTRSDYLYVHEWGTIIMCASYDNHFIYENPDKKTKGSAYLCTCGSQAVVTPPGPGGLFVCLFDATYGNHQTTFINSKDREKYIDKMIEIVPGKRVKAR